MFENTHASEGCPFCFELQAGHPPLVVSSAYECENRFVAQSEHFVVFPSATPITVGHLLVVPKTHVCSFREVQARHLEELQQLLKLVGEPLNKVAEDLILFEHGVPNAGHTACGINHAHVHLLPCNSTLLPELISKIEREQTGPVITNDWSDFVCGSRCSSEYLAFGRTASKDVHLISKETFPSQTLRRAIAELLHKRHQDWRLLGNRRAFNQTLGMFI